MRVIPARMQAQPDVGGSSEFPPSVYKTLGGFFMSAIILTRPWAGNERLSVRVRFSMENLYTGIVAGTVAGVVSGVTLRLMYWAFPHVVDVTRKRQRRGRRTLLQPQPLLVAVGFGSPTLRSRVLPPY